MIDTYEPFDVRDARQRVERAEALAADMQWERDQVRRELEETRRAVEWTMGKLKIADIIMHHPEEVTEARHQGELDFNSGDTDRMSWINQHGRVGIGNGSVTIALPYFGGSDEEIPVPYNIRHLIDICRQPKAGS